MRSAIFKGSLEGFYSVEDTLEIDDIEKNNDPRCSCSTLKVQGHSQESHHREFQHMQYENLAHCSLVTEETIFKHSY